MRIEETVCKMLWEREKKVNGQPVSAVRPFASLSFDGQEESERVFLEIG